MATFVVIGEHPPELCPTSNAQTRKMLLEGASQVPQLAQSLRQRESITAAGA
jgi:hypothetical protein